MQQRNQQDTETKMVNFMHPGFVVSIGEVESTVEIDNPFVGIITDLETGEVIHTVYASYMTRLIGILRLWLYNHMNREENQQQQRRFRFGN
jgi:hypothetical protein